MYVSSVYICIAPVAICGMLTCRQWPERGDTTFTQVNVVKAMSTNQVVVRDFPPLNRTIAIYLG